jgi:hypothetical protein
MRIVRSCFSISREEPGPEPKSRTTNKGDLLYMTEHAYFVNTHGGHIVQLNSEAVGGVIYDQ